MRNTQLYPFHPPLSLPLLYLRRGLPSLDCNLGGANSKLCAGRTGMEGGGEVSGVKEEGDTKKGKKNSSPSLLFLCSSTDRALGQRRIQRGLVLEINKCIGLCLAEKVSESERERKRG